MTAAAVEARYPGEPLVLLAIVSGVWGLSSFLVHAMVATIAPATAAAGRLAIGAVTLALLTHNRNTDRPRTKSVWNWGYAGVAFFGQALPFFLISWAQVQVTPSTASVLIAMTPVFAAIFVLWGRPPAAAWRTGVGVAVGLAGLTGFVGASAWAAGQHVWPRELALVVAALSFAFAGRLVAQLPPGSALIRNAFVSRYAAAMLVVAAIVLDHPWTRATPSAGSLGAMVVLAVLSTCVAYVAYYRLISVGGLPMATSHHYIAPIIALTLQFLWMGTVPTPLQFVSIGAIIAAVALIAQRPTPARSPSRVAEKSRLG